MKILWVKADFLHPTTKGGHIRTLEMLKALHRRHEIHYAGIEDPERPEGVSRSSEYCSFCYPIRHHVPAKRSLGFAMQLAAGLVSPLPVAVARYRSRSMRRKVDELLNHGGFDRLVCDFLFPAPNIPDLSRAILFEHNVESMIWRRHAEHAAGPARRKYFDLQARHMFAYEGDACRKAALVVAVSAVDAEVIRREFHVSRVEHIPTGVDVAFFTPPAEPSSGQVSDLVFTGSMDWMPNIDGVRWFLTEILPLIRRRFPGASACIAGRRPAPEILALAKCVPGVGVTGTVPDIRPYLWNAGISVTPLRIGSGTRLKIYESMAAKTPVVSTSIGAEGLPVTPGRDLLIADTAESFAASCVTLLESAEKRRAMAQRAWELVSTQFSWESVAQAFEALLDRAPRASP